MTQRTRRFLLGAALVLVVGLCTGLVAHYSGNLPFASASAGPAELRYLPGDTMAVAYANVRSVMDSRFRQQLRQALPSGEEKEKLHAEIGVDLERDVDSVVAGLAPGALDARGAVVLVRGRFTDATIEAKAVQHGARIEEYRGTRLIVMQAHAVAEAAPGGSGAGPSAHHGMASSTGGVAFLEPGLLALGELSAIKRAIDAGADGTSVTKSDEMMKFVSDVNSNSDAWFVGRVDQLSQHAPVPDEIKSRIPALDWFIASANINGGISAAVRAEAQDEKAAEQLRDVVRGALAGAQLFAGQDARIEAMLKGVQVSGTGKSVAVAFTVPAEVLDVINGLAGLNNLTSPRPSETIRK
jgi:hypothetical protein